jgi:AraC-like DNA-binding protein
VTRPVVVRVDDGSVLALLPAEVGVALEELLQRVHRVDEEAKRLRLGAPRPLLELYDALVPLFGRVLDIDTPPASAAAVRALVGQGALPFMDMGQAARVLGVSERQARRLFPRSTRPAVRRVWLVDVERELARREARS